MAAIEPIVDGRGPGRRTHVWIRGRAEPLVASRAEGSIVDDLVTPADEAARMRQQREVLRRTVTDLERVRPALRRVIAEESDVDLAGLAAEARRVLG